MFCAVASSTATTDAAETPASSSEKGADETPRKKRSSSASSRRPASRGSAAGSLAARATSAAQGKKLVLLGTVGTGALALVAAYRPPDTKGKSAAQIALEAKQRNPFRIMVGVFVAGTMLAALAEVQPKLAAAFSMLMLTTAAFVVGGDAWQGIASVTRVEPIDPKSALANVPKTPAKITQIGS